MSNWKSVLDELDKAISATDVQVIRLDGERLLVFKNGAALRISDRGKVLAFLDQEQTQKVRSEQERWTS